jgi:ribosome-associated toxin RatA of RatAB toxin-antitoxin module
MRPIAALTAIAAAAGLIAAWAADPASAPHAPKVKVDIAGDTIRVDVDFLIDAPRETVWAVLTDFERMPRFVSNLKESRVLERTPGRVHLIQKGVASFGPITFSFESEREIQLAPPDRIHSRLLRGNLKRYHGDTILHAQGQATRLEFRSEAATDAFIPPYFGRRFVENETREQFVEIAAEIARLRHAAFAPAAGAAPTSPTASPTASPVASPAASPIAVPDPATASTAGPPAAATSDASPVPATPLPAPETRQ